MPESDLLRRGLSNHFTVIEEFVPLKDNFIVDIGCGDGQLCRDMAKRGAAVLGVEADPVQAEKNRHLETFPNVGLTEGKAQQLPLETAGVDTAIFHFSLHHIPETDMQAAIEEAIRVLKPAGGLYVAEPVAEGLFQEVIKHFHDETHVRLKALNALQQFALPRFRRETVICYHIRHEYVDFNEFVEHFVSLSYNNHYSEKDVCDDEVEKAFSKAKQGDIYSFDTPVRVNLYEGLLS